MQDTKTKAEAATTLVEPQPAQQLPAVPHHQPPAIFSLQPRNFDEMLRYAEVLADSEFVPKDYRGKPGNVIVAVQWGSEVGLKPLQAMQNIAVINGRPGLWGDAMLALVRSSPLCEYVVESMDADGVAMCRVKRRGEPEQIRTFSDADAKTAGLLGKDGPWKTNPKRMKQMRARAFALRDVFTDVLKGMQVVEELMDMTEHTLPPLPGATADAGAVQHPGCPAELRMAGRKAADGGAAALRKWWAEQSNRDRWLAEGELDAWKIRATEADEARKPKEADTPKAADTPAVDAKPAAIADPAAATAERDSFVEEIEAAERRAEGGDKPA